MMKELTALSIIFFHDKKMSNPDWPDYPEPSSELSEPDVWHWIAMNHCCNTLLWQEEDRARRTDVSAQEIATSKRLIDRYNQQRNDATEAVDEAILTAFEARAFSPEARLNSETAGAMIDRLSILALKIFHMREQTQRTDADDDHIWKCEAKLARLLEQRDDLAACFDALMSGMRCGTAYFKVYRQFKMYNDPTLNPYLYSKQEGEGKRRAAR
jgi:hypothetical protein